MGLVFDSKLDTKFKVSHFGQLIGGSDKNGHFMKVGDTIKFEYDGGNCKGSIYYDMSKFRYVILTEPYSYVRDFSGVKDIEVI